MLAKFASACVLCGELIREGTPIRFDDDEDTWVHVICAFDRHDRRARCPYCADLIPPGGACPNCGQ
jgi:hypothetical protein